MAESSSPSLRRRWTLLMGILATGTTHSFSFDNALPSSLESLSSSQESKSTWHDSLSADPGMSAESSNRFGPLEISDGPPDCSGGSNSRYHALVCWLWNAQVKLPDQRVKEGIITVKIKEMTCTNFQVSSMTSSFIPSASRLDRIGVDAISGPKPSIELDLRGISATCTGKYDISGFSGTVIASVSSPDGPMHLKVDIASSPLSFIDISSNDVDNTTDSGGATDDQDNSTNPEYMFPSQATLVSCQTHLLVHGVKFTGSASAELINPFSGAIGKKVTSALNENICPLVKQNTEAILNKGLNAAKTYVGDLIKNTPASAGGVASDYFSASELLPEKDNHNSGSDSTNEHFPLVGAEEKFVRWDEDMPFLKRILLSLNNFASDHLDEGIVIKVLQKLSTWKGAAGDICEDCGFFFKGLNGLVNNLTKGKESVEISIPETILGFHHNHTYDIPNYGEVVFTARTLKVTGLNGLTDLSLLRPVGENKISNAVSSNAGFNVTISLDIEIRPAEGGIFHGDPLHETFELNLNASEVDIFSESFAGLDREIFRKLSVGSFIYGSYIEFENHRNIFNCVLETLASFELLDLQAQMNLNAMQLRPVVPASEASESVSLEENVDDLINNVLQLVLSEYTATMTETIAGLARGPARRAMNKLFRDVIADMKNFPLHCINVDIPNLSEKPLELDNTRAIILFDDVVNQDKAISAVNSYIDCVDNILEVNNLLSGHFFNMSLGEFQFVLHDLHYDNIDSVYELELLGPDIDHYHLTNSLGYGMHNSSEGLNGSSWNATSLAMGINLLHTKHGNLGNINVQIKIKNLKLNGGTNLKFDMNWLPHLKVSDLLAHPQCLSIPATELSFYGFDASIHSLELTMQVSLTGQKNTPHSFQYHTADPVALANIVSSFMSKGSVLLEEVLNKSSIDYLDGASNVCTSPMNPNRNNDVSKRSSSAVGIASFLIVALFVAGNAWLFFRGFNDNDLPFETIEYSAVNNDMAPPREEQPYENEEEEVQFTSMTEPLLNREDDMDAVLEVDSPPKKFFFSSSSSLMSHPSIPKVVKYGFPIVLVFAAVLFMTSNLTVGASVDLSLTRANGKNFTSLINIYSFSLSTTMAEMIQAGVYFLMLLIWFCSGLWPYVKIVLMLFSWLASTKRLSPIRREKILYLLDALGKFSLIDAYVLVLMMVAFRYEFEMAGVGALNVYVTPKFGFYSFLFATIASLISGHVMLFLHRRSTIPTIPVYSGRSESLSKHIFDDKHGRGLVKLTKRFRRALLLVLILSLLLICIGVNLKCFHFKFNGAAGTALGDSRIRKFSLISIGQSIPSSVQTPSSFGIHWIQTCYFFFALVMPIVCLLSLFILFVYPMTMKQQRVVFVIAEIANAWSAIEVFVIAIIASLVEISPFSESMVAEHCTLLNKILSGWSGDGAEGLNHCFGVKSSFDGTATILIIGVILNSLLVSSLHRFAHHAMWERIEREDRPEATEEESKIVRESVLAHRFISKLRSSRFGKFMFEEVSFGPHSEYEIDFENVTENEEDHPANFWSEWRKIVSVI